MRCAALSLILVPASALAFSFLVLHRRRPEWTHWPILASCAAATGLAFWLGSRVAGGEGLDWTVYEWIGVGGFSAEFGLLVDGVSASVLMMVTLVGALIHVYAVGYMRADPSFSRFFLYFHFFYLSMLGLLLSNNYLQMYLFWEGVGLASYLLIGFWHEREAPRQAALKAFLTNRVGDAGFMLGAALLWAWTGSLHFPEVFAAASGPSAYLSPAQLTLAAGLLAWAAAAKSAQFPLYIWLPDAMEGPTPTSALMHAATMVTAGVFLLARSYPIVAAAPGVPETLAAVGALTALGACVVASVKTDLKRVLAYSTVSHLGLMTLALGLGDVPAALYHLVMHGFFKAVLFLCAGNVLHALGRSSAPFDETGGLGRSLPWTFAAFGVAALSLAGIFPFAGFFSKDRILDAAFHHGGPALRLAVCLIAAGSAFYVTRMLCLVFLGPSPRQSPPEHPHEASGWMLLPCLALALGAAFAGLWEPLFGGLEPLSLPGSLLGTALAFAGASAAAFLAVGRPAWDWEWRRRRSGLAGWIDGDFGWQGFVLRAFVRPARRLGEWLSGVFDAGEDRAVEGLAAQSLVFAQSAARLSSGLLNEYLWWLIAGTAALAWVAR